MQKYSGALKERFSGDLDFGPGRVTVDKVVVIPQPLGALVLASSNRQNEFGRDSAHLVFDVGYFTTGWVYPNGFTMDAKRSVAIPGQPSHISQLIPTPTPPHQ